MARTEGVAGESHAVVVVNQHYRPRCVSGSVYDIEASASQFKAIAVGKRKHATSVLAQLPCNDGCIRRVHVYIGEVAYVAYMVVVAVCSHHGQRLAA